MATMRSCGVGELSENDCANQPCTWHTPLKRMRVAASIAMLISETAALEETPMLLLRQSVSMGWKPPLLPPEEVNTRAVSV